MKNLKKIVFLLTFVIVILIYLIYDTLNENVNEFIVENLYVETNTSMGGINKIFLHITGEVKSPRNYTNR